MKKKLAGNGKTMMTIGAAMGWIAVIAQLVLIIQNRVASVPATIVQFFSYFTILSNIIAALCYSFRLASKEKDGGFWGSAKTQGAVAVYILVVGIVYNLVLRFLWAPTGAQKWVDELLHLVVPLYFLVYWILFAPKTGLEWRNAGGWLIFPLVYLIYVLIRGAMTDLYPYPFLDAYNHGYQKVITSAVVILLLFLLLSITIIALAKKMAATEREESIRV
jgi:hypothetical protein